MCALPLLAGVLRTAGFDSVAHIATMAESVGPLKSYPNLGKFFLLTRNLYLFLGCVALGLHAFAAHARVLWHGMRLLCCALAGHCWTD